MTAGLIRLQEGAPQIALNQLASSFAARKVTTS